MEFILGIDLATLLKTIGLLGIIAMVFAESGLLIGFFLPGDSMLFTAGFLASQGFFSISLLMALCFVAAVLGDNAGYMFGKRVGVKLFTREDSFLFHKKHLERASRFYELHGGKTLVLARFMPVVRTFVPILAGVGNMKYSVFFFYNMAGGLTWTVSMTGLGYVLGRTIPNVDRYIIPLVVVIIIVSFLPPVIHMLREKEHREEIMAAGKKFFVKIFSK